MKQDTGLYGDGWTPLMAAAVAGRQHIAMLLLQRAGTAAVRLVQAANRYGLTATHIAARSGNVPLLRALLEFGGGSIANVRPPFTVHMSFQRRRCFGNHGIRWIGLTAWLVECLLGILAPASLR